MDPHTLLDQLILRYPAAKRQTLKRMVESGRVRINGQRAVKLKQEIQPADRIEVSDASPRPASAAPDASLLTIIHEDDDLLVVHKPPGLLTSTVPRERRPTLLAMVRAYCTQRKRPAAVGLIHRLDRDAGGLLIFSLNDPAYRSLKSQFFHHTVTREYHALVHGSPQPPKGRIETRLVERADGTVHATRQAGKGQRAISEYQTLASDQKRSLVRVTLLTGRKHQIRVHLAGLGTPIVGDAVYGTPAPSGQMMLLATRLTIRHPRTDQPLDLTLPVPDSFSVLLDLAGCLLSARCDRTRK